MLGKVLALSTLVALVLLLAMMQSTTPSTIHPAGILFVFILLYVSALGVLTFFVFWGGKFIRAIARKNRPRRQVTLLRAYYYGTVLALAPVVIVGAQSIGRLGPIDVVLVILFEFLACFYIARRD